MSPDASAALAAREKVEKFLNAARTGNLDLLKKLAKQLDDGKGLAQTIADVKDAHKRGALHFAARDGQTEVCKYLLEELKLDVNTKEHCGETPLMHAAREGHTDTAKYLIECGADPAIPSERGVTALHLSAGIGDIDLMKFLLAKGVNVDLQSGAGGTPLRWAAGHCQQDAVKLLLEHNSNPNAQTEDGVTPLLAAIAVDSSECSGLLTCLGLLIKAGASVNFIAGGVRVTPLHIAADICSPEVINCLLQAGANPNAGDKDDLKPIQVAAARGNKEIVKILLPVTSPVKNVPDWSVDGIIGHVQSENIKKQVTPEAKKKAAEAKARGEDAFKRKDYMTAVDAYTQAIDSNPSDAALYSNRSLCWLRLGQADHALADAKMCRGLRPDWPKACYREGAALRLMQKFEDAADAFDEGVRLDPKNEELVTAFREAVECAKF